MYQLIRISVEFFLLLVVSEILRMIELIHCDKYVKLTGHYRPGMVGLDNYVSVDYSCCIFDLHTALTEHDLFPHIVNPRQGLLVLTVY